MEYVLTGFRQESNVRLFAFEAIADDRSRKILTVTADLALIRKYRIPLQELPLLCRRYLETHVDGTRTETVIFSENDMQGYFQARAAAADAAEQKKKGHRVPGSARLGQAWRTRLW